MLPRSSRPHPVFWPFLWLAALLLVSPAVVQAGSEKTGEGQGEERQYVRVNRDDQGNPVTLETAVVRMRPAEDAGSENAEAEVIVDLIGVIHVGERDYFEQFNEMFKSYDVLLYELVAPEAAVVPAPQRGADLHPVSSLQQGMKSLLGLEFQLDHIDYTAENFVHADMTAEEFARSMRERGESFFQMFFRLMGQGIAEQSNDPRSDARLLMAMFSRDRELRLKRILADQLQDVEGQTEILGGPDGSTIITERNKKALEVLREQLDAGKKKIGIFYGAGHLADFEERMEQDFQFERESIQWLPAWSLTAENE